MRVFQFGFIISLSVRTFLKKYIIVFCLSDEMNVRTLLNRWRVNPH